jgi:hypothetical protein
LLLIILNGYIELSAEDKNTIVKRDKELCPIKNKNENFFPEWDKAIDNLLDYINKTSVNYSSHSILIDEKFGYGKTSFSNLVRDRLSSDPSFPKGNIIVEFYPTLYPEDIKLYPKFLTELSKHLMDFDYSFAIKLWLATNKSFFNSIPWWSKAIFPEDGFAPDDFLLTLINKKLTSINQYLVIFIDDIDRLSPKRSFEILQLLLSLRENTKRIFFIIPASYSHMIESLRIYFNCSNKENEEYIHEYIEKIFDYKLRLPEISFETRIKFLSKIFEGYRSDYYKLNSNNKNASVLFNEETISVYGEFIGGNSWFIDTYCENTRTIKKIAKSMAHRFCTLNEQLDPYSLIMIEILKQKFPLFYSLLPNLKRKALVPLKTSGGEIFYSRPENNLTEFLKILEKHRFPNEDQELYIKIYKTLFPKADTNDLANYSIQYFDHFDKYIIDTENPFSIEDFTNNKWLSFNNRSDINNCTSYIQMFCKDDNFVNDNWSLIEEYQRKYASEGYMQEMLNLSETIRYKPKFLDLSVREDIFNFYYGVNKDLDVIDLKEESITNIAFKIQNLAEAGKYKSPFGNSTEEKWENAFIEASITFTKKLKDNIVLLDKLDLKKAFKKIIFQMNEGSILQARFKSELKKAIEEIFNSNVNNIKIINEIFMYTRLENNEFHSTGYLNLRGVNSLIDSPFGGFSDYVSVLENHTPKNNEIVWLKELIEFNREYQKNSQENQITKFIFNHLSPRN